MCFLRYNYNNMENRPDNQTFNDAASSTEAAVEDGRLAGTIRRWVQKIDKLNDKLEVKTDIALKNKFITPEQEKELSVVLNHDALHNRYLDGEISVDLLEQLKNFYWQIKNKKNEIFPEFPGNTRLRSFDFFRTEAEKFRQKQQGKDQLKMSSADIIPKAVVSEPGAKGLNETAPPAKLVDFGEDKKGANGKDLKPKKPAAPKNREQTEEEAYRQERERGYKVVDKRLTGVDKEMVAGKLPVEVAKESQLEGSQKAEAKTTEGEFDLMPLAELEREEKSPVDLLKKAMEQARVKYIKSEIDAEKVSGRFCRLKEVIKKIFGGERENKTGEGNLVSERELFKKIREEKLAAYEAAKTAFARKMYEEKKLIFRQDFPAEKEGDYSLEINALARAEEKERALAQIKVEVLQAAVLTEKENLNFARIETLAARDKGICRNIIAKYGELPRWSKVLISASAATGATMAFSSGVGLAMFGSVFAWKILRSGAGVTAGLLAGKGYNWAFNKIIDVKNIGNKGEQEIIKEIKESLEERFISEGVEATLIKGAEEKSDLADKTDKKEDKFEKWFSELSAATNQKLDSLAKKERRILLAKAIGQAAVIIGAAGLTSWGLEKALADAASDLTVKPAARDLESVGGRPAVKVDKMLKAGDAHITEFSSEPSVVEKDAASDLTITPAARDLEKLAEIKKGDGIETVLIRQLKAAGLTPEQAGAEAHKIALAKGWVKIDSATGKMIETRVFFDAKNPAKYLLSKDAAGNFDALEGNAAGKTYLWLAPDMEAADQTSDLAGGGGAEGNLPELLTEESVSPEILSKLEEFRKDGVKNILRDVGGMKPEEYEAIKKMTYRDYLSKVPSDEKQAWQIWRERNVNLPHDESGLGLHTAAEYRRQVGLSGIISKVKNAPWITNKTTVEEAVNELAARTEAVKSGADLTVFRKYFKK